MTDATAHLSEPPTNAKVVFTTTFGDIDVELWGKQAPQTCRNFLQLCLEGYYNGCAFHKIQKGLLAQTGDPTGTGFGGESVFGKPFKDEFHSRLRFGRRGLLGMANAGEKNTNASQFFFTLGECKWLHKQNTMFGKIPNDTIYNLMKLQDVEVDDNGKPTVAPRILKTEVLINPFLDIIPRFKVEEAPTVKKKKKKKLKKNIALLSFGEEAALEEKELQKVEEGAPAKGKSSHDLLHDDATLAGVAPQEADDLVKNGSSAKKKKGKKKKKVKKSNGGEKMNAGSVNSVARPPEDFDAQMRAQVMASRPAAPAAANAEEETPASFDDEFTKLQKDIKSLSSKKARRLKDKAEGRVRGAFVRGVKASKNDSMLGLLEQRRAMHRKLYKKTANREEDTLAKLAAFKNTIISLPDDEDDQGDEALAADGALPANASDDDADLQGDKWLSHRVTFVKRPQDEQSYDVMDPTDPASKAIERARQRTRSTAHERTYGKRAAVRPANANEMDSAVLQRLEQDKSQKRRRSRSRSPKQSGTRAHKKPRV